MIEGWTAQCHCARLYVTHQCGERVQVDVGITGIEEIPKRHVDFGRVTAHGNIAANVAETVAREAVRLGVARLVLISGLGADPQSRSPYIRSRGRVQGSGDNSAVYDLGE